MKKVPSGTTGVWGKGKENRTHCNGVYRDYYQDPFLGSRAQNTETIILLDMQIWKLSFYGDYIGAPVP